MYFISLLMPGAETLSSFAAPAILPVTMMARIISICRRVSIAACRDSSLDRSIASRQIAVSLRPSCQRVFQPRSKREAEPGERSGALVHKRWRNHCHLSWPSGVDFRNELIVLPTRSSRSWLALLYPPLRTLQRGPTVRHVRFRATTQIPLLVRR